MDALIRDPHVDLRTAFIIPVRSAGFARLVNGLPYAVDIGLHPDINVRTVTQGQVPIWVLEMPVAIRVNDRDLIAAI